MTKFLWNVFLAFLLISPFLDWLIGYLSLPIPTYWERVALFWALLAILFYDIDIKLPKSKNKEKE